MKKFIGKSLLVTMLISPMAMANGNNRTDNAETEYDYTNIEITADNHTGIYPFVPEDPTYIQNRIKVFVEDENALFNLREMDRRGLNRRQTTAQPWTGNVWGLNKGIIASPYSGRIPLNPLYAHRELTWQGNHLRLTQRVDSHHRRWRRLSQRRLNRLAPSEKYDLLLGDEDFGLTAAMRDYLYNTATQRSNSFLTALHVIGGDTLNFANELVSDANNDFDSLEEAIPYAVRNRGGIADQMALGWYEDGVYSSFAEALNAAMEPATEQAQNYVLKGKGAPQVALWEGICNGWAPAAGKIPRPRNTVTFKLPNGKDLNFFPTDIKALASLMFAHNLIQDVYVQNNPEEIGRDVFAGTFMEGLRCNNKEVGRDPWGRRVDILPDPYSGKLEPRCIGVHPAIWHLAMVNLIGVQGRSFMADKQVKAAVWNYPLSGYQISYFNPNTGEYGDLADSIVAASTEDQFHAFRAPETRQIVGLKMTMNFIGTDLYPSRRRTDSPRRDFVRSRTMLYDLELDARGNIIGGQWRATEVGAPRRRRGGNHHQPDFIWSVTKNWARFFPETEGLTPWTNKRELPPSDWLESAQWQHSAIYSETWDLGWNNRCEMEHSQTGEIIEVGCEHQRPKPRPMTDVVKNLVELSAGESW